MGGLIQKNGPKQPLDLIFPFLNCMYWGQGTVSLSSGLGGKTGRGPQTGSQKESVGEKGRGDEG